MIYDLPFSGRAVPVVRVGRAVRSVRCRGRGARALPGGRPQRERVVPLRFLGPVERAGAPGRAAGGACLAAPVAVRGVDGGRRRDGPRPDRAARHGADVADLAGVRVIGLRHRLGRAGAAGGGWTSCTCTSAISTPPAFARQAAGAGQQLPPWRGVWRCPPSTGVGRHQSRGRRPAGHGGLGDGMVLTRLAVGASAGEALRQTRWEMLSRGNVMGLAYALRASRTSAFAESVVRLDGFRACCSPRTVGSGLRGDFWRTTLR